MTSPRPIWKRLAVLLLCLIVFSGGAVLAIWYFHTTQQHAMQAELSERGESLSIESFIPPPVPDAENFFADPLWMELTEPSSRTTKSEGGTDEGRQLDRLTPKLTLDEVQALKSAWPDIPWPTKDFKNKRVSLLNDVWRKLPREPSPEQRRQWAGFTLAVLHPVEPLFKKLRELSQRPYARFPLKYADGITMDIPHMRYLLNQSQMLLAQARAEIYLGRGAEALEDVDLILGLAESIKTEPTIISLLLRSALIRCAFRALSTGLENHTWTTEQLLSFEDRWKRLEVLPKLPTVLRGERAMLNRTMEKMIDQMSSGPASSSRSWTYGGYEFVQKMMRGFAAYLNVKDLTAYNRQTQAWLNAIAVVNPGEWPTKINSSDRRRKSQPDIFWKKVRLAPQAFQTVSDVECNIIETEVRILQARLACALERYWLKHGNYPNTLAALVPDYLSAIPIDLVDPQPMQYRLIDSQKYLLYSIGCNKVDEGGTVKRKFDQGDWVWGQWNP